MAIIDPEFIPYRTNDCGQIEPNPMYQGVTAGMDYWIKTVTHDHTEIPDGAWQWMDPRLSCIRWPDITYVPPVFPEPYYPMDIQVSQPIAQGWECPRCHRINAPSVSQCTCGPKAKDANDVSNGAPQT